MAKSKMKNTGGMLPPHIFGEKRNPEISENKIGKIFPEFAKKDAMPEPDFSNVMLDQLKKENEDLKEQLAKVGTKKELLDKIKELETENADLKAEIDKFLEDDGNAPEETNDNSSKG